MKITVQEAKKRYNRLDTLRVLTEGYEEGEGYNIYQKAFRAENKSTEEFTGIIRFTATEKDFLGYILSDNEYLDEYEKEILRFYIG